MAAQQPDQVLAQAQQVIADAEQAGATTHATALLDEARADLRYAQQNWSNDRNREEARMRAMEALWAGRAAFAKARWLSTNANLRIIAQDVERLGGRVDVRLPDEAASAAAPLRDATLEQRLQSAQQALERARGAGAEEVARQDLQQAQEALESARRGAQSDNSNNRMSAAYSAGLAELIAQRAYYTAQSRAAERYVTELQAQRTRLNENAGQRQVEAERLKREQAEREATELRQRLENEQAERRRMETEAQQQQLRTQVEQAQQAAESAQQAAATAREENRRLRFEQELARLAATRQDPRGLIVTLPGIFFDTGKAQLKPGSRSTLTNIARQIASDPNVRVSVEGHTDSVGSDATNQRLSELRASAVRDALVAAGIPADRITAIGRGEEAPIATNNTAAGKQQNRRVELVITQ
ncbi:MAG TPA: OmpA family protein [Thermoanaerobaculia bacterium]|jgi:outer membrane protein OmpA-like peptidoglycan-associated protein